MLNDIIGIAVSEAINGVVIDLHNKNYGFDFESAAEARKVYEKFKSYLAAYMKTKTFNDEEFKEVEVQ